MAQAGVVERPFHGLAAVARCGTKAQGARCESGHTTLVPVRCGREYCPTCGRDDSAVHRRRQARFLARLRKVVAVDYWVVTFPLSVRQALRDPVHLRAVGRVVSRVFRALGYARGLRRWHWRGDRSAVWNPHLNVIIPGGFVPAAEIERVKAALVQALTAYFLGLGITYSGPWVINMTVRVGAPALQHLARYVTRATFGRWEADPDMAMRLEGFRNASWWGTWSGPDLWQVSGDPDTVAARLHAGLCPHCGAPIARRLGMYDLRGDWAWSLRTRRWYPIIGPPGEYVLVEEGTT